MLDRNELVKKLQTGIITVVFTKVTGEKREMRCTLDSEVLPALKGSNAKKNQEVLPVWDVEKQAWRSFRLDSVLEVR